MTQMHKEFVNQIKETLHTQKIPPCFNIKEWRRKNFNCYAYAMRICLDLSEHDYIWPGFISKGELENDYTDTKECVVQYFIDDCESLGLQVHPTTIAERIGPKEYKIAVYIKEGVDFHFVRQDIDGRWSEKNGWKEGIKIVRQKDIIKCRNGYEIVGVFRVSKK